MSEKIYTRLLRLYPSGFRKKYEGEAMQLIRDRFRDEKGFFKRARLWCDLLADVLAGLPAAYRNSYALTEAVSLSVSATGIPSFKSLDEEPLGLGSILVGGTISLIVLAAFAFLLSRPIAYRLAGSNGKMSPIESVMQRLNRASETDQEVSSPEAGSLASAQMGQAQPAAPGTSMSNLPPSSSEGEIANGEGNSVVSAQPQNLNEHTVDGGNASPALETFSKAAKQTGTHGQEFAHATIAGVPKSSLDLQGGVQQSPRYSGMIAKLTPTVALSYLPANPAPGSMVTLTATVLAVGTGPAPTGDVRFFDGSALLNMGELNNGTVTVKGKLPSIATHSLRAIYDGDANYGSASSIGEGLKSLK